MTLQVTARGAVADPASAARLGGEFAAHHSVVIPSFIPPPLLARIQDMVDAAEFKERLHGDIASELGMAPNACLGLLHFLVNEPAVFRFVERVTGVAGLRGFVGRVYRRLPGTGHHDSWHTDVLPGRDVGMSVNLSRDRYDGGVLELRADDEHGTLHSAVANVGAGDAMLFRIADGLQHRVSDVTGTVPKTAFAGWFSRTHDYAAAFREEHP